MRALRVTADALLTVAAIVGVLGFALFVGVRLGAVQPLVVTSGSMRPTYETGDLVVSRTVDADTLETGDVATLRDAGGRLITHRVVAVLPAGSAQGSAAVSVQMKGDANAQADPQPYVVEQALVPVVRIPGMGPWSRRCSGRWSPCRHSSRWQRWSRSRSCRAGPRHPRRPCRNLRRTGAARRSEPAGQSCATTQGRARSRLSTTTVARVAGRHAAR